MKRRDFIRQTGLFTAGLLLHQQILQTTIANEDERIISVGIISDVKKKEYKLNS